LLGLKLASNRHGRVELADPASLAALSARAFHEGLTKMARYKRLFCSEDLRLLLDQADWHLDAVWHAAHEPTPQLLTDSMFAAWLELGRRGTGQEITPVQVTFRRAAPAPAVRSQYEAHFGCPVAFAAKSDQMRSSTETLAQEGTGFQAVLEQVRREMARHYLQNVGFDLTEVAYLLGYQEPSSFHRAFQHWEGTTPGQWRSSWQTGNPSEQRH